LKEPQIKIDMQHHLFLTDGALFLNMVGYY
jgi:hypothetical protein